jgi:amidase
VPASYNGIYGMRPTHGRISLAGVMPLAPSFDTVGWFARDPQLLATAGRVLLNDWSNPRPPRRLLLAAEAFAHLEPALADALGAAVGQIEATLGPAEPVRVADEGLDAWHELFRTLQGAEAWAEHGAWIDGAKPRLGPFCLERMRFAATVTAGQVAEARRRCASIRDRLSALLADDAVLLLPSAAGVAPRIDASMAEHEAVRARTIALTSIASLAGLPQVSLPLARLDAGPVGLSLIAARGHDVQLLELAARALAGLRQTAAR